MPVDTNKDRIRGNPQAMGKYLPIMYLIRNLYLDYTKNSKLTCKKANNLMKNGQKHLNRNFTKDVLMKNKNMKICPASLATRELQIKSAIDTITHLLG